VHKIGFDKDLSLSTVKATREVMSTMMGMEVEAGQVRFEKIAPRSAEVIGSVGVAGVLSGSITIFLDMELAKTVTANMLMMDPGEIEGDEEIVDAIGETANMIAGNIKTHLFDKVPLFDIATPSVTIGRDVRRTTIANRFGMIAPFLHEGREFHVEFLLVERESTEEKGVSLNILTQEQAPAE
jgi:chemotaxis protein CheX